jgi:hypothetical protein
MTLTAILPLSGLAKGWERAERRNSQASATMSAFSAV